MKQFSLYRLSFGWTLFLLLPGILFAAESRVIKLQADINYPPYTYYDATDQPAGFLVDLLEAMEAESGQQFDLELRPWSEIPDNLRNGEMDGILGMFRTAKREIDFNFSQPTYVATHSAFVRDDAPYQHLEDLQGKAIIVQNSDVMDDFLQANAFTDSIVRTPDQSTAIRLLAQGEHDAAFLLRIGAWQNIQSHGIDNLRELDYTLMPRDYCIAVAKGDAEALHIINAALQTVKDSGSFDRIRENWFTRYAPQPAGFPYLQYLLWLLVAVFIVAMLFAGWSISLRSTVERQTAALQAELHKREIIAQTLQEREQFIRAVLETTPDYVTVYDLDEKRFIYMNKIPTKLADPALTQAYEFTESVLRSLVHPEDRETLRKHWRRLLKTKAGEVLEIEYRLVNDQQGAEIWMQSRDIVFKRQPSGRVQQCLSIIHDITHRKLADAERAHLEAQMQQAQKLESLGILAGGIAHDFNNILLAILGNADLALTETSNFAPTRGYLEEIERASRRAAELCRQMLAYSGKGKFVISRFQLNEVIREMEQMLRISISKKIQFRLHLDTALADIEGDITQIRQVVMNLIINASDAIGKQTGAIDVHTGVVYCDRDYLTEVFLDEGLPAGDYVYLDVTDTGCGMDQETLAKIFDPFFSTKFTGRGLGLAAVIGIVRGHRGALKVYSEMGKGSTFKILLPAALSASPEKTEPPERKAVPKKGSGLILVVDDEVSIRKLAQRMLKRLGYEILTAEDGEKAVEVYVAHQSRIDCVLLDLTMPNMDGAETYEALYRLNPEVRCVLSSGYNQQAVTQNLVGLGFCGFVQKPYTLQELSVAIHMAMHGEKFSDPTPAP